MFECEEFQIHSTQPLSSLSLQAFWAVLSLASSCLCISPENSLQTSSPTISCSPNASFNVHTQIKCMSSAQTANTLGMKTKRCMKPHTLHFSFRFLFSSEAHLKTCSKEQVHSTKTLLYHTHAITTTNLPPLVITTLTEIQPPESFDQPSHQTHPLLCFTPTHLIPATVWFIAPLLGHFPSPYSSAVTSHFCSPLMPLKKGWWSRVHWQTEIFTRPCALLCESKRWQRSRTIQWGTEGSMKLTFSNL